MLALNENAVIKEGASFVRIKQTQTRVFLSASANYFLFYHILPNGYKQTFDIKRI